MTLPVVNETKPSVPQNVTIQSLNGLLTFGWTEPVVRPVGTEYRIVAGVNCADATASNTIIWQGEARRVTLPFTDNSTRWFFWLQAHVGSQFSGYVPNTFGTAALPGFFPDNSLASRPVPDPAFQSGLVISSYWFRTGAFSLSPTGGMVDNAGFATLTGTSGIHNSNLLPDHRSVTGYRLGQVFGASEFPVQAGRVVNWSVVYRRTTAVAGSGGQASFALNLSVANIVGASQAILPLTTSATNFRRVDTIALDSWFTFNGSALVPNSSWDRGAIELAANATTISSGTVQIGRFDAWLT